MTEPHDERDRRLADLVSDSVSDVEPANRLGDIRSRTHQPGHTGTKVTTMNSRRPWLYAVGGAVVATAAVITAIAAAGGALPGMTADDTPSPGTQPSHQATKQPEPSTDVSQSPDPSESPTSSPASVEGVYFVGDTPQGPRLYREFLRNTDGVDPVSFGVEASVTGSANDPDYRTLWPAGTTVAGVSPSADRITVEIAGAPTERPSGMSAAEARLAVQQVVYSAQAAAGEGRVPVQIKSDSGPVDTMLGVPVSAPIDAGSALQTLSLVSLSNPSEGESVSGDTLKVDGVANSFEANVVVRLQRWEGTEIVDQEPFTASGYMGDKLYPFSGTIDISQVPPGDYVLMAMTDDPSGGEGGGGSFSDTRRITIE